MNDRELRLLVARYVNEAPTKAALSAARLASSENPQEVERAEAIVAALDEACRCRRCGRKLTDPVSVERHIGPECVTKEEAA